jgi:hypothetical protein
VPFFVFLLLKSFIAVHVIRYSNIVELAYIYNILDEQFYRVQVSVQSPEGITTMRGVLRRFNDFLKLLTDLKRTFPRKGFPSAPPKGLLRMKSRAVLEEVCIFS